ncbi:hypothetical protein K1719_033684 [Acacia pycnantha]|nr:hypothetical protein K1719_033684 [Acacia pycnantha]
MTQHSKPSIGVGTLWAHSSVSSSSSALFYLDGGSWFSHLSLDSSSRGNLEEKLGFNPPSIPNLKAFFFSIDDSTESKLSGQDCILHKKLIPTINWRFRREMKPMQIWGCRSRLKIGRGKRI